MYNNLLKIILSNWISHKIWMNQNFLLKIILRIYYYLIKFTNWLWNVRFHKILRKKFDLIHSKFQYRILYILRTNFIEIHIKTHRSYNDRVGGPPCGARRLVFFKKTKNFQKKGLGWVYTPIRHTQSFALRVQWWKSSNLGVLAGWLGVCL